MGWEDPLEEGMVQPTSVFLPENPMDKRSLVSYSPLQGASSAHGKGHEEGGLAYAKAGSSLRSLPGNS